MDNIGRFVGNYLKLIGYASLVSMLVAMLWGNFITVNLTFILLIWAGSELCNYNPTARTWVIRFSFLCALAIIAVCIYIGAMDKQEVSMVMFGVMIENLSTWLFYVTMGGLLILCLVPPFYLLRVQARKEFEHGGKVPDIKDS